MTKHQGGSRARAHPPFNVSRLDWGGAGFYTFLLPIQSIPGAREGLDEGAGKCARAGEHTRALYPETAAGMCVGGAAQNP